MTLVKENYPVNFLLIGPVDKKDRSRFLGIINNELIKDRIHYIPWIDASELSSYLDITDVCLAPFHKNPQHESGVANKIYEYMLGKKPVIVSDCLPQKRLMEKHNCGLVFSNQGEFHDAIIKLITDSKVRMQMGQNGYEAVINEYNTRLVRENLLSLYKSMTN